MNPEEKNQEENSKLALAQAPDLAPALVQEMTVRPEHTTSSGIAARLGQFAFKHKEFFTSRPGELMFRNALRTLIAVVPTVTGFMLARTAFEKYEGMAAVKPDSVLTKIGQPFLGKEYPVGRATSFIFAGFTPFRLTCRMWQRAYDRLFSAKNVEEATQVIKNIPNQALKDAKEILPAEVTGVAVGAFPLAAVKAGFANPATINVNQGQWGMAAKGFKNDWLASSAAYVAFFESADRIYTAASGGKDTPAYYKKLKGIEEAPAHQPKKYGFFTDDGLGKLLFARAGSVLVGVAAWMGGQRVVKAAVGVPDMTDMSTKGFMRNLAKEYAAFAPFAGYTVAADIYNYNYDKLFSAIESKHQKAAGRT